LLKIKFSVKKLKIYEKQFLKRNVKGSVKKSWISIKKNEMKNQILFFNPAKIARARERATALEKAESQRKRIAADRKMQQTIAREEKAWEAAKKKARKKAERTAAREKAAREKAAKTAEKETKKA
jgi:hypothetical protein